MNKQPRKKSVRAHSTVMPLLLALRSRLRQRTLTVFDYTLLSAVVQDVVNDTDPRALFFADWPQTRRDIENKLRRKRERAAKLPAGTVMLKADEVAARVGLSKGSIYRLARNDEFPKPVKLSTWASAWYAHEVEQWLQSRPRVKQ